MVPYETEQGLVMGWVLIEGTKCGKMGRKALPSISAGHLSRSRTRSAWKKLLRA